MSENIKYGCGVTHWLRELRKHWKAQRPRHVLWAPVWLGAGMALYYGWPREINPYMPLGLTVVMLMIGLVLRRFGHIAAWPMLVGLGMTLAAFDASDHSPVMLREALSPRFVSGVVRDIERKQYGVRLLLSQVEIEDVAPEQTPHQIRLSVRFKKSDVFDLPRIGERIDIRAGLMPSMGPALPRSFDFARYFYLRDIGAIGYGLPPWWVVEDDSSPRSREEHSFVSIAINQFWSWRANLTDRIVKTLGPETGGIAAGLITGDARAISDSDFDALRASNLYHIIAISGEHMVVISGVIFLGLRLLILLALPSRLSLRPEGKSILAALALALVTVYLFVTGLPTSAVRAYVMIALVLFAVIFRRHVDPMRSLAITALLLLLYDPTHWLDPGFRLSFAATLALIALIEVRVLMSHHDPVRSIWQRLANGIGTVLLISVVAELATAPVAISMFNNASFYGVLANSLATPLVSIVLMPLVALFFVLLPFGLESWALTLLHYGITGLLSIARLVASLPHARIFLPSPPDWGLALFTAGLLFVCLWQTKARRWGGVLMLVGFLSLFTVKPPDILVGANLKQIAFRSEDGYVLARGRPNALLPEQWANGLGYAELPKPRKEHWRCEDAGCLASIRGQVVRFVRAKDAAHARCDAADLVITDIEAARCESLSQIIFAASKGSAVTAVWLRKGHPPRVETSADWQGERLWRVTLLAQEAGEEAPLTSSSTLAEEQ